jgi:phototropin
VSTTSNGNGTATSGVADFFSPEVFQIVLHNPATAHQLLKFSQARMSGENMEFLERVRNLI